MFYRLEPDVHAEHGITGEPHLPEAIRFTSGEAIRATLPDPLTFEVDVPPDAQPGHLLGSEIPVVSERLLRALREAGAQNVQTFPASLHNPHAHARWGGFHALNVIGMVDAVDLQASTYDTLMEGSDALPPLLVFSELVFARARLPALHLFRLPQSPTSLVMSAQVREQLIRHRPEEGWGITAEEIAVR